MFIKRGWQLVVGIFLALIMVYGGQNSAFAKDIAGTIQMDGLNRTYHVHLPAAYNANVQYPVVIILHGARGQGEQIAAYTGFSGLADKENFIAVYPDGYNRLWSVGWKDSNSQSKIDDVAFIRQMIDNISSQYSVDQQRIYVTGMSMGGMFSHRLAIELSDRIAAIAPVSGTLPERMAAQVPNGKMPVLMLHGTADPIVPYQGGLVGPQNFVQTGRLNVSNLSVEETARYWAKENGCQLEPVTAKTIDSNSSDGTKVIVTHYKAADGINDVWVYTVEDGGHTWPGTAVVSEKRESAGGLRGTLISRLGVRRQATAGTRVNLGTTSHEINASEIIWQFFKPIKKA